MMFGVGMGLGWIILLVILGGGIWQIFRQMNDHASAGSRANPGNFRETPLDILKKRYARGEISETEYKEMRRNL